MAATELVEIGYVVKTHGVKGHLKIIFNENIKELSTGEALFFLVKGEKIPYFIGKIEYIKDAEAIVLLDEISSPEEAERLSKKPVWGKKELVEFEVEDEDTFDLNDFIIMDEHMGEIGKVMNWYEMNEYILLETIYQGKEILIPFHDETVIDLNEEEKIIYMKVPDGLLEH